jgi:hypothetical protein
VRLSRFIPLITLAAGLLLLIVFLMMKWLAPEAEFKAGLAAVLVSYLTTLAAYSLTYPSVMRSFTIFLGFLMTGVFAKILVGLAVVVVVALKYKEFVREYVVVYFFAYFIFTGFEVYGLMRKLRPHLRKRLGKED